MHANNFFRAVPRASCRTPCRSSSWIRAGWSIARGLARRQADYKRHLAACDMARRNDLDGRGNLSEEALTEFTRFFLEICIDQVTFMEQLMQPDRLRARA